ncbi:hypothetical protein JCM8547_000713 [Rhodosporidiobolus lusitaniae]
MERVRVLAATGNSTLSNSTLSPAVCTPDLCLTGDNSLTAGVLISSAVNGSTQQIALLPGTYSSSSSASSSSSLTNSSTVSLSSALFSKKATASPSSGFSTSGSLSSSSSASYTVSLLAGLTAYTSALYQGDATYLSLPTNYSSANSTTSPSGIEAFLLTSSSYAILTLGESTRLVVWESLADVGEIKGGSGSGGVSVVDVQSRECTTPCASGGVCASSGKCVCGTGWTGETCNTCASGFFGKSCDACSAGCTNCDEGLTGTGRCLDVVATNVTLPSTCDCSNGECASDLTSATCTCNAGWTKAANGTQCAACAEGYYMTSGGDCLACDPSCATCSSPSGTCLTCQSGLQPSSSSSTRCITATTALSNGTFITCPSRTFFSSSDDGSPNVLLGGECVAMDSKTGVCDGSDVGNSTTGGGYVYDNNKGVCDALPARCTAGGIDNFSSSSTRSQLTCSACISGSFLVDGACVETCPDGMTESSDGLSCEACDSSCATCSTSASFCTSCASSSSLILNGTCISGPSCPTGYFSSSSNSSSSSSSTATCLACHPDCLTCTSTSQTCTSCPSSRPVLTTSSTCVPTCSSTEYFDTAKSSCTSCSSECATCSGSGSDACLSCASGKRLSGGKCIEADDCPAGGWVDGFGVCLSDLVTVSAVSSASEEKKDEGKWTIPWWTILMIVLSVLGAGGGGFWWWRKKEKERRKEHTRRFADELDQKKVKSNLSALPTSIAYPPLPRAPPSPSSPSHPSHLHQQDATYNVPLTPRFVLEDPASPVSVSSYAPSEAAPPPRKNPFNSTSRWSTTSSSIAPPSLKPQQTGASAFSAYSSTTTASSSASSTVSPQPLPFSRTFTTKAGNTIILNNSGGGGGGGGSKNPFLSRM